MSLQETPWHPIPTGLSVAVRLTPKGGRDAIDGVTQLADGRPVLKVRVRPAAQEGAANAALRALMADALGMAPGRVALASGASARLKLLHIEGDPAALAAGLATHIDRNAA